MKRLISILVVFVLVTALLAGCNGDSTDTSSTEIIHNPTPRNIDFKGQYFYGSVFANDGINVPKSWIFREYSQLKEAREKYQFQSIKPKNQIGFNEFADGLTSSYFETKSIILIRISSKSDMGELRFKELYIENGNLEITVSHYIYTTMDMESTNFLLVAEVDKSEVIGINEIEIIEEQQYFLSIGDSTENVGEKIDYESSVWDGYFEDFNGYNDKNTTYGFNYIIHKRRQWDELIKKYAYSGNGNDLNSLSGKFNEEYFESKSIIAIPVKSNSTNIECSVIYVYSSDTSVIYKTLINESVISKAEAEYKVIIIEIDKKHIPENCQYYHRFTIKEVE